MTSFISSWKDLIINVAIIAAAFGLLAIHTTSVSRSLQSHIEDARRESVHNSRLHYLHQAQISAFTHVYAVPDSIYDLYIMPADTSGAAADSLK